jgi:hypothetical protein
LIAGANCLGQKKIAPLEKIADYFPLLLASSFQKSLCGANHAKCANSAKAKTWKLRIPLETPSRA